MGQAATRKLSLGAHDLECQISVERRALARLQTPIAVDDVRDRAGPSRSSATSSEVTPLADETYLAELVLGAPPERFSLRNWNLDSRAGARRSVV